MGPRALLLVWLVLAVLVQTASAQTCEAALAALKKASLELETRLKRCRTEERHACDIRTNSTRTELEREKDVSARLRELLRAKDLERKVAEQELIEKYKPELEEAQAERNEFKAQVAELESVKDTLKSTEDDLRAEKKKTIALANSLEDCKASASRDIEDTTSKLEETITKQSAKIESMTETLEARDAEVEQLRRLVKKLEEQKRASVLEWFKNPNSLDSLLEARNKTLEIFAPGLDATERKLLALQAASSQKIESIVGMDSETSALVSGLLAWGILLIPFFLSFCLLVRVRLSLSKMVLWASLYAALFCAVLFGFSYGLGTEALYYLKRMSPLSHDVLLILLMLGNVLLIVSITLLTLKQWLVSDLGSLRVRHMLQVAVPLVIAIHYYYHYYYISLAEAEAAEFLEDAASDALGFDEHYWLVYAMGYFVECFLLIVGTYSSSQKPASPGKPSPAVAKAADVVNKVVDAVEGGGKPRSSSQFTDVEAGEVAHSLASGGVDDAIGEEVREPAPKKSKKKKSKHKDDASTIEVLGPSDFMEAVVSATSGGDRKKSSGKGD